MSLDGAVVLGGTGFIGAPLCASLRAEGYDVVAVSRTPPGYPDGDWVPMDLAAPAGRDALTRLLTERSAGLVVNAAGAVWGGTAQEMDRCNVALTEHVVAAVRAAPASPRLVQLGTVHEYGPGDGSGRIGDRTPARPVSPYGSTKLRATTAVLAAAASGVDAVVLRLANAAGPGAPRESLLGFVAHELGSAAKAGGPAVLRLAPLRDHRDFIDVRDVSSAVIAAARAQVTNRVVNIGTGEAVAVRRLVRLLVEYSGVPAEIVEQERPQRPGSGRIEVDITSARRLLGWTPRYRPEDTLAALWRAAAPR